ncbi:hypothetical protein QR680_006840 [Steinernema hermaphroditum]|uniref:RING-type domain-containing protein n=1 Tax=Steinernema hermaphroditum TaxID=289476 RepID=A0AA39HWM6_9BILA|nr:hypothetical protein QR680_006840 [Steinernema hermaphroditum]
MSCVICFSSLLNSTDPASAISACGHVFHTDCLRKTASQPTITRAVCPICRKEYNFPTSLMRIFFPAPPIDDEERQLRMENERMQERIVDLEVRMKRLEKDNEEAEKRIKKLNVEKFYLENEHAEVVKERNELKERYEKPAEEKVEEKEEKEPPKEYFKRSFSVRLRRVFKSKKVNPS